MVSSYSSRHLALADYELIQVNNVPPAIRKLDVLYRSPSLKDIKAANPDIPVVLSGVTPALELAFDELGVSSLYDEDEIKLAKTKA